MTSTTYRRNSRVEAAPFEAESILFHPDTKQFVKLNRTTAVIWDRLASGATAEEVAESLCSTFRGVTREEATKDAGAALDELSRLGLVTTG